MPVLCDFTLIVGNTPVTIGDSNPVWSSERFNTGGRETNQPGFLIFNVRGLTHSDLDVAVSLNGTQIGTLHNYRPGGSGIDTTNINQPEKWRQIDHWYTQMIAFTGNQLNDGDNRLQLQAVQFPENTQNNRFDEFQIKDVFCFFHQNA